MLSGCQVARLVVLHKELDPDDGEMTHTRKVRRSVIADSYADLIAAMQQGRDSVSTRIEVTCEDGRKGENRATLTIVDARTFPPAEAARIAAQ